MHNKHFTVPRILAITAAAFAVSGAAQAQSSLTRGTSAAPGTGFYVGGSLGQSHWKDDSPIASGIDRSDTSYKVFGGYEFTPNVAVELGYADLGKFEGSAGDVKSRATYLDAVGTLPFNDQWAAIGRVGVVDSHTRVINLGARDSDHDTGLKVGAGLQYSFSPTTAVRGEWERYRVGAVTERANIDVYSLGLVVKF